MKKVISSIKKSIKKREMRDKLLERRIAMDNIWATLPKKKCKQCGQTFIDEGKGYNICFGCHAKNTYRELK